MFAGKAGKQKCKEKGWACPDGYHDFAYRADDPCKGEKCVKEVDSKFCCTGETPVIQLLP